MAAATRSAKHESERAKTPADSKDAKSAGATADKAPPADDKQQNRNKQASSGDKQQDKNKQASGSPAAMLSRLIEQASAAGEAGSKDARALEQLKADASSAGKQRGAGTKLPASGKSLPSSSLDAQTARALSTLTGDSGEPSANRDKLLSRLAANSASKSTRAGLDMSRMGPLTVTPDRPDPAQTFASLLNGSLSSASQASPPPTLQVPNQHLGSTAWRSDFSQQIVWLANNNVQSAKLQLNPRHLGPIEVHIQLAHNQTQAQVWLHADNSATRAAIQSSLPQLQQMFDQQGLGLAQAHVSAQGFGAQGDGRQPANHASFSAGTTNGHGDANAEVDPSAAWTTDVSVVGLVDAYA